jgi:hypothetical protein
VPLTLTRSLRAGGGSIQSIKDPTGNGAEVPIGRRLPKTNVNTIANQGDTLFTDTGHSRTTGLLRDFEVKFTRSKRVNDAGTQVRDGGGDQYTTSPDE